MPVFSVLVAVAALILAWFIRSFANRSIILNCIGMAASWFVFGMVGTSSDILDSSLIGVVGFVSISTYVFNLFVCYRMGSQLDNAGGIWTIVALFLGYLPFLVLLARYKKYQATHKKMCQMIERGADEGEIVKAFREALSKHQIPQDWLAVYMGKMRNADRAEEAIANLVEWARICDRNSPRSARAMMRDTLHEINLPDHAHRIDPDQKRQKAKSPGSSQSGHKQPSFAPRDPHKEAAELKRERPVDISMLFDTARELHNMGKVEAAVKEYKRVIEAQPDHVAAHYQLALAFRQMELYNGAIAEYQEALRHDDGRVPEFRQSILDGIREAEHLAATATKSRTTRTTKPKTKAANQRRVIQTGDREIHVETERRISPGGLQQAADALRASAAEAKNTPQQNARQPRSTLYRFVHEEIRQDFFSNAALWALSKLPFADEFSDYIQSRWQTFCLTSGAAGGANTGDFTVHAGKLENELDILTLTLPKASNVAEAYFIGFVYNADVSVTRYFVLEQGESCTYVCEWSHDGRHLNYGIGPQVDCEQFRLAVSNIIVNDRQPLNA